MGVRSELIAANTGLLAQALPLLDRLSDSAFSSSPEGLAPHRVGSHLRHLLDFYDCFLDGLDAAFIDYDARTRDEALEQNRDAAAAKVSSVIRRLEEASDLSGDRPLDVRMEGSEAGVRLRSSVGRELQALSSHTTHHFALISVTLRLHGVAVDPRFGMSPSTLRFEADRTRPAAVAR